MSDEDVLAPLSPPQLAAFYRRLADGVDGGNGSIKTSLAALQMRHWLDNRDPTNVFKFDPPDHLRNHTRVNDTLAYHRAVYLTEEQASFTGGQKRWTGIVPRLQGKPPYPKWDGTGLFAVNYESLVEMPLRYQVTGNDVDRDLLICASWISVEDLRHRFQRTRRRRTHSDQISELSGRGS
jgi:hypothetical protein